MPYNWLMWYIRVTLNAMIIIGNAIAMLALFFCSLPGWGDAVSAQVTYVVPGEVPRLSLTSVGQPFTSDRRRLARCILGGVYNGLAVCWNPLCACVHALARGAAGGC